MRFSKAPIIATLMAGALFALVALPALAAPGIARVADPDGNLEARVYQRVATPGDTGATGADGTIADAEVAITADAQATRRDRSTYVSNQWDAYNQVNFVLTRGTAFDGTGTQSFLVLDDQGNTDAADDEYFIRVRSGNSTKRVPVTVAGGITSATGYFYVVERETTTDNLAHTNFANDDGEVASTLTATDDQIANKTNYGTLVAAAIAAADTVDAALPTDPGDGSVDPPFTNDMVDTQAEIDAYDAIIDAAIEDINSHEVEGGHDDTITISSGPYTVTVVVDARAPDITNISPSHNTLQSSGNAAFGFTVTDNDSGLRSDREAVAAADGGSTGSLTGDGDADNASDEPLARQYGYAEDIALYFPEDTTRNFATDAGRIDNLGSQNWFELVRDGSYEVSVRRAGLSSGNLSWYIAARDRVGNVTQTDSDLDESGAQSFTLRIDDDNPDASDNIYAGIGFNTASDKRAETRDSSSILVLFDEANGLATDTIQADDFVVAGNTVVNVIHPNAKKSTKGSDCKSDTGIVEPDTMASNCIDTRNRVYLQLENELADDATPQVQVLGGAVRDRAGNGNNAVEEDAKDWITPTIAATVTGDASGATGRPLAMDDITVTVSTGERLRSNPQAWIVAVDANGKIAGGTVRRTLNPVRGSAMTWSSDFGLSDVTGTTQTKGSLAAVIIRAEDRLNNVSFTTGWKGSGAPAEGNTLDLAKLDSAGLLAEFDSNIDAATPEINPDTNTGDEDLVTESRNPFIELTFSEGSEYKAENVLGDDPDTMAEETDFVVKEGKTKIQIQGKDDVKVDSYAGVWITAITLDDVDVMDRLEEVETGQFSLALAGLDVDDYTLEYTAKDTAGNEDDFEVNFEVIARRPYTVGLRPGWNLVSLPANPTNTLIDSVLPSDHPAQSVLSYQSGEWLTSSRDTETGEWIGTLTDIEAGYGYFIQTDGFEALSTAIPEADPTTLLPTVAVVQGWNLLGVVDADQAAAGSDAGKIDVDSYLTSIEWRVAYGFNTQTSRWDKLTPESSHMVVTGSGYWVWATKSGTLVP